MYWCDCDNTRGKFVDGLSSEIIDGSASAISDCYPECIHISAARDIVEEEVDTVFGLSAGDEFAGKFEDSRLCMVHLISVLFYLRSLLCWTYSIIINCKL